jgi:hypothetical protein
VGYPITAEDARSILGDERLQELVEQIQRGGLPLAQGRDLIIQEVMRARSASPSPEVGGGGMGMSPLSGRGVSAPTPDASYRNVPRGTSENVYPGQAEAQPDLAALGERARNGDPAGAAMEALVPQIMAKMPPQGPPPGALERIQQFFGSEQGQRMLLSIGSLLMQSGPNPGLRNAGLAIMSGQILSERDRREAEARRQAATAASREKYAFEKYQTGLQTEQQITVARERAKLELDQATQKAQRQADAIRQAIENAPTSMGQKGLTIGPGIMDELVKELATPEQPGATQEQVIKANPASSRFGAIVHLVGVGQMPVDQAVALVNQNPLFREREYGVEKHEDTLAIVDKTKGQPPRVVSTEQFPTRETITGGPGQSVIVQPGRPGTMPTSGGAPPGVPAALAAPPGATTGPIGTQGAQLVQLPQEVKPESTADLDNAVAQVTGGAIRSAKDPRVTAEQLKAANTIVQNQRIAVSAAQGAVGAKGAALARQEVEQNAPLDEKATLWMKADGSGFASPADTLSTVKDKQMVPITQSGLNAAASARAALQLIKEYRGLVDKLLVDATGNAVADAVAIKTNQAALAVKRLAGDPDARRFDALFGAIATLARGTGDTANIAVAEREFLKTFVSTTGDSKQSAHDVLNQAERILLGVAGARGIPTPAPTPRAPTAPPRDETGVPGVKRRR